MIGGIAVIARGVPRVTRDVDVAFSGAEVTLSGLLRISTQRASSRGSMTPSDLPPRAQVLLSRHARTGVVIDVSLAWLPFEDQQDVERLLALHGARMDLARVRRHVQALGETMEEDRIHALDALILRVLGR